MASGAEKLTQMIALDTNVLLRLLTHDNRTQLAAIGRFFAAHDRETFFVPDVVLVETVWTLRAAYGWKPLQIAAGLRQLAAKPDLELAERERFSAALKALETGADFADELILGAAREQGCSAMATFDVPLQKRHPQFVVGLK